MTLFNYQRQGALVLSTDPSLDEAQASGRWIAAEEGGWEAHA